MRIGIDLGGTKIEGIVLADNGREAARQRVSTPTSGYEAVLDALCGLVKSLEDEVGQRCTVGMGTPGVLSPTSGRIRNSNLTSLNGTAIDRDFGQRLARPVRVDNDANCFVLSEATDGAVARPTGDHGDRIDVVFGATLGTGVGGGIVIDGRVHGGANGTAAEWSHTTLPFLRSDERSPYRCFCSHDNCIESFISGRGLAGAYREVTGNDTPAPTVAQLAAAGDAAAGEALGRYEDRLARALAGVINLIDPRAIVLGGGVSNNPRIFETVPRLWQRYTVASDLRTALLPARHGDASGVRGAAWLWPPIAR